MATNGLTFEQRMDRLTARHEALTESVETILAMQRENEKAIAEQRASIDKPLETAKVEAQFLAA